MPAGRGAPAFSVPARPPGDLAVLCQVAPLETLPSHSSGTVCRKRLSWLDWVSARLSKLSLIFFGGWGWVLVGLEFPNQVSNTHGPCGRSAKSDLEPGLGLE